MAVIPSFRSALEVAYDNLEALDTEHSGMHMHSTRSESINTAVNIETAMEHRSQMHPPKGIKLLSASPRYIALHLGPGVGIYFLTLKWHASPKR